jgi:biotin carboxylase
MKTTPRLCAIVDAYSTGRFLPSALRRYGVECVHVRSATVDIYRPPSNDHGIGTEVIHDGDLDKTVAALRGLGVDYVIAGSESGVVLAEELADRLGLPGNGMRDPMARRNKYKMAEAVRRAGIAAADTLLSASAEEIVAWASARGQWPVVLKPTESAGADNVIVCSSADEVRAACQKIMASLDRYGRRNQAVLAMEFLDGEEYFINTVSRNGVHHIVEIWRYQKKWARTDRLKHDYEYPVPADDPEAVEVGRYTLAVLDALEITDGAAHPEVMFTARGPVLVECNARLCGSILPDVVTRCLGTNQVELTALSIARPEEFARIAGTPYELRTHLRYVSLINPGSGVVPSEDDLEAVRSLPSFVAMTMTLPAGRPITQTVDLASSPGYVYLASDDPRHLERDYRRLRELEATTLYAPRAA